MVNKSEIAHVRRQVAKAVPVPITSLIVERTRDRKLVRDVGCEMITARSGFFQASVPWGPRVSLEDVVGSLAAGLRHNMERYYGRSR